MDVKEQIDQQRLIMLLFLETAFNEAGLTYSDCVSLFNTIPNPLSSPAAINLVYEAFVAE